MRVLTAPIPRTRIRRTRNGQYPNLLSPNAAVQSRAQVPGVSQSPVNPANTTIPQFPLQPGNPISPL